MTLPFSIQSFIISWHFAFFWITFDGIFSNTFIIHHKRIYVVCAIQIPKVSIMWLPPSQWLSRAKTPYEREGLWPFFGLSYLEVIWFLFKDPPQKTTTLKKYKHLLDIQLMTTETSLSWMSCLWQLMNWPFIFLKAKKLEREWLRKLARSKMTLVKIAKLLTYSTFPKNSIMILGYFDVCRNW